jgi:tetratricopeptide (TPR) repeat protein
MNAPLLRPLALVVSLALAANAFAGDAPQPGTPEANAAAKRLYISATKHFDLAEYPDALNDFKEAYRLKDDPVFLYNIAQCYRILNKNDEALSFYRSYLRRAPDAPNRAEVEAKISALQEAIATQEKARTTPKQGLATPDSVETPPATTPTTTANNTLVASAPPPAQKTPVYKKWWLWTAVGAVVVVGVGVGLGVGLSQQTTYSAVNAPGGTFRF